MEKETEIKQPENSIEAFDSHLKVLNKIIEKDYSFSSFQESFHKALRQKTFVPKSFYSDESEVWNTEEELLKALFFHYFVIINFVNEKESILNDEEKKQRNSSMQDKISLDPHENFSTMMDQIFYKSLYEEFHENSSDNKENLKKLDHDINLFISVFKDVSTEIFDEKIILSTEEAIKFHHFEEENEQYCSSKFLLDVKKAYSNFVHTKKCKQELSLIIFTLFVDYLNSTDINGVVNLIPQEIIDLFYAIALLQNEDYVLQFFSDVVMNKTVFKSNKFYTSEFENPIGSGAYSIEEAEKKFRNENSDLYCLHFAENRFLPLLEYFSNFDSKKYGLLKTLYEYTFTPPFQNKGEDFKNEKTDELFKELFFIFGDKLSKYPGIVYCLSTLLKYFYKGSILEKFTKKNLLEYKKEWKKLQPVMAINHEQFIPGDIPFLNYINDPASQKKEEEKFKSMLPLFMGIFTFQVYSLFSSSFNTDTFCFSQEDLDIRKHFENLIKEFHFFVLHTDYDDEEKIKSLFYKVCSFSLNNENLTNDFNFDFENNSKDLALILYYFSRFESDYIHPIIDFVNTVREKQLEILSVVPDKFRSFSKEEAEVYKKEIEQNQQILKNDIDIGFEIYVNQSVSKVRLFNDYSVISRAVKVKTFTETDKKYNIYYYEKKDYKGNKYYKFDKKEDFRVTNKNHLENHYIYSDRNVFTHQASNYMIIENLMEDDHAESLLYAFYDIKNFLNQLQEELANMKNFPKTGIFLLQQEFRLISDQMFKKIVFNPCKDYWEEVFDSKGKLRLEYSERCKNLDYYHDFGSIFMKDLNEFLIKIYSASDFIGLIPQKIFLYLIVQTLKLEKYREK